MNKTVTPQIYADERRLFIRVHLRKSAALLFVWVGLLCIANAKTPQPERHSYKIDLKVDFDSKTIAGVFVRRLRKGMKLQTDPTVIYGLGGAYDGNLKRVDLERDTPWNTYTRTGLPPTPIAMPGEAAL